MEYPGAYFTRPWRLALLALFILAFCLIAPLVILTTAGYKFNWHNYWPALSDTGSLSININPANAVVYINGTRLTGGMPYRLNALAPGQAYTLKISSPGYYDWQKDIPIESGATYYLKDITMIKKNDPQLIAPGAIAGLSLSPNGRWLLYTQQAATNTSLMLWDTNSPAKQSLIISPDAPRCTIYWHNQSAYAAIKIERNNYPAAWYLLNAPQKDWRPIAKIIPGIISQASWNANSDPELYVSVSTTLFVLRPLSDTVLKVGLLPSAVWQITNGHISSLTFTTNTRDWVITEDVFGFASTFARVKENDLGPYSPAGWELLRSGGNSILLKSNTDSVFKLITKNSVFTVPGEHWLVSPFNNWLIIWSQEEIYTYADTEAPRLLNRSGENLRNVAILDKANTLALSWTKSTTALYPYYLINHQLLPGVTDLVADSANRRLWFSGNINGQNGLWQLNY